MTVIFIASLPHCLIASLPHCPIASFQLLHDPVRNRLDQRFGIVRRPARSGRHVALHAGRPVRVVADRRFLQPVARIGDVEALLDRQLVAGQRDGLAVEAGGEDDAVAVPGAAQGVPERPGPGVEVVQDRQRAEGGPVFEGFEPRQEPAPTRRLAAYLLPASSREASAELSRTNWSSASASTTPIPTRSCSTAPTSTP